MPTFLPNIDVSSLDGSNGFRLSGARKNGFSGLSVASAGDVNGDGFDDVIVGAFHGSTYGAYSRASFVVFGKASGFAADIDLSDLNGSNGFMLTGPDAFSPAHASVASAGDVNGDGFDDIIVGALDASPHGTNSGASYVVFGKASGFAANIDLTSLNGSNGFKLSGVASPDQSGFSVASARDVNGDGVDDLIIGAPLAAPSGGLQNGVSYVVFGKTSGFAANLDLSTLNGSNGFKLTGVDVGDASGTSVASAGDVNGDGIDDLIIGAPMALGPGGQYAGASYVVFGKTSGFDAAIDLSTLDGSNGFKLRGTAAGERSGFSVASAGDVNGDGFDDLIIGTRNVTGSASYVVFGKSHFGSRINLSSLDGTNGFKLSGAHDYAGISVASAGDFNGDGFDDVIIGAGGSSGGAYVVFGRASGFAANIDLSTLNGFTGFKLSGNGIGRSVASAGDVNGDGFDDLIVGAPYSDVGGTDTGASYVVFGHAGANGLNLVGTDGPDTLTGGSLDDMLSGLGSDDTLNGLAGNDYLDGGPGADTMAGGSGDDTYYVDNALDAVVEAAGGGTDTVLSSVDYTLAAGSEVEVLAANAGSTGLALTGNEFANTLKGGAGNDMLDGGTGADTMIGGSGDDTYHVDNALDVVNEAAGGGTDTVLSSVDYSLAPGTQVEVLTANAGSTGLVLGGNEFNDTINGAGGNDTLSGGAGRDSLYGNDGNDTLLVRNGDVVASELYDGGAGTDTLRLGNATTADLTGDTISGVENFVGSSGNDTVTFTLAQFEALGTLDAGGGSDTVTFKLGGAVDISASAGPVLVNLEALQIRGSGVTDVVTVSAQQFSALHKIDLDGGSNTVNVALSGAASLVFPILTNVTLLKLLGSGSVSLTVAQAGPVTSVASGVTATLADTAHNLQALSAAQIGLFAGRGFDRIDAAENALTLNVAQAKALGGMVVANNNVATVADAGGHIAALDAVDIAALDSERIDVLDATNGALKLTVAQALALGHVALAPADDVVVADSGANLGSLTAGQLTDLGAKGVDSLDATDGILSLGLSQFEALGSIDLTRADTVTLVGTNIGTLSAGQIGALYGENIDKIDATNNALSLGIDQFDALGRVLLSADDALTLTGTAGNDRIAFSSQPFSAADQIDGAAGNDMLSLSGDYGSLVFAAGTMTNVEKLSFGVGHDYDLTLADGNVGNGQRLTVSAVSLGAADSLVLDGSAETDGGRFMVTGGAGADVFTGGTAADDITLGGGADLVRYTAATQSTSTHYDTINGFDASTDHLHVWSGVTAVDASVTTGALTKGHFDANLGAAMTGLLAQHAVLFTANSGNLAGVQFLVVDTNGTAGYQGDQDLAIRLDSPAHLDQLGTSTFV